MVYIYRSCQSLFALCRLNCHLFLPLQGCFFCVNLPFLCHLLFLPLLLLLARVPLLLLLGRFVIVLLLPAIGSAPCAASAAAAVVLVAVLLQLPLPIPLLEKAH